MHATILRVGWTVFGITFGNTGYTARRAVHYGRTRQYWIFVRLLWSIQRKCIKATELGLKERKRRSRLKIIMFSSKLDRTSLKIKNFA